MENENKFTDEEIIRALGCCLLSNSHQEEECDKCPLYETPLTICQNLMAYYALDLINRQKAEIKSLEDTLLGKLSASADIAIKDLDRNGKEMVRAMKAGKVCSIGDKLYIILEDETAPGGWGIEINNVTEVGERFIFYSGYYPPRDDILNNVPIEDIGKDVFLDEAEFRRELERRRLAHDV